MVKINLLPKEEKAKPRVGIPKPSIKMPTGVGNYLGIGFIIVIIIILALVHMRQRSAIKQLNVNIEETRKELRKLDEVVKLVKELDRKRKDLDARIEIIRGLNRGRFEKAKFLYNLSSLIPDYCWIQDLQIKGNQISIKGITFSNQVIAEFMRKLQGEKTIQNVELINIAEEKVEEHSVMKFDLESKLTSQFSAPIESAKKGRK
jgi:type IV pilus assembly protein PilN